LPGRLLAVVVLLFQRWLLLPGAYSWWLRQGRSLTQVSMALCLHSMASLFLRKGKNQEQGRIGSCALGHNNQYKARFLILLIHHIKPFKAELGK
jgi:hypothetical protein